MRLRDETDDVRSSLRPGTDSNSLNTTARSGMWSHHGALSLGDEMDNTQRAYRWIDGRSGKRRYDGGLSACIV